VTFALLAAGGTGGHVYPALALAEVLVERGRARSEIRFVGGRRTLEREVVPAAGFEIDLLPGRGLRRAIAWSSVLALVEALQATILALAIVGRRRPRVVVGFGGYASLPALVAARVLRVPAVVHEQNAAPGLANRIAVRLGARAAASLPSTPLRGVVVTGNPVRPELLAVERRPSEPPLVLVTGGSLGAGRLNDAALELYDLWRDRDDVRIRHVTGRREHGARAEALDALRRPSDRLEFELVAYDDDRASVYAETSIVVGRAGASTVAEITALGLPSVLVPLPGAPGDHQGANARALAAAGGAVVVDDASCTGAALAGALEPLLADRARRLAMGEAARALGRPDAAERLADLVEACARG
jgi:UDP-N-acetylglucosamine--N-acetylmuramyl-(pentapeptide) pyrophosphoryl-undecaprenol N-acetylglucosamine transferase